MPIQSIRIPLPLILPGDAGVKLALANYPSTKLTAQLSAAGFMRLNYPDISLGSISGLDAAVAAVNASPGNMVYRAEHVGNISAPAEVAGDLLTLARAFIPDATEAHLARVDAGNGSRVVNLLGRWVVWADGVVGVTS